MQSNYNYPLSIKDYKDQPGVLHPGYRQHGGTIKCQKKKTHTDIFPCQEIGALEAQTSDKRVVAHTPDPVSHVPYSTKHKREQHR